MQEWLVLGVDTWQTEKMAITMHMCKTVLYSGVSRAQHLFACSAELEGLGQDSAYNGHFLALITGLTPFSPGLESVVSPGDRDLDGSLTSSGQTK